MCACFCVLEHSADFDDCDVCCGCEDAGCDDGCVQYPVNFFGHLVVAFRYVLTSFLPMLVTIV